MHFWHMELGIEFLSTLDSGGWGVIGLATNEEYLCWLELII